MISIPDHIANLSPYKPGKSSDPSAYERYKAILSSNENNYGPSPKAMEAILENVTSIHLYPDPQGERLTQKLSAIHGRSSEEIILSNGLDGLLYSMFKAFTVAGDEVITNDNSFVAFNKFAKMNALDLKVIPNVNYHFDLERLVSNISAKTKIIYLCNPNNPTGGHINKENLKQTLNAIPSHILVVIDEAYFDYALKIDPEFPNSIKLKYDNILSLRTFSKLYGLAGLRIGYGIASKSIIDALRKVKLVFNPNSLAQAAALAALEDEQHVDKTIENNVKWVKILHEKLASKMISFIPSYANFVCSTFPDEHEALKFFNFMDKNGILLRKLDAFGMPEAVRISIGSNKEMIYFSEILERF